MKFNHHYDTNKSNTKDFIKNLSPSLIVQTSDSLPWKNGVDNEYVNWLKERGIERINAASKNYDATVFDIRQDGLVNISTSYKPIQVFKLVGIRVLMETGGIKHLILQENMLSVGMKLRVNGITLTKRVSYYRINGKNGTIVGSI